MQTIPLSAVPSQSLFTTVNNQNVQINVYQKRTGVFMDLFLTGPPTEPVLNGILCRNQCFCIMNAYFGFVGDFMWVDLNGLNADPIYTALGSRFSLVYLFPTDIPSAALFAGLENAELNPPAFV